MDGRDHSKTSAEGLEEIQASIYRERVLRARAMSDGERCSDVFEVSSFQFGLMHAGALQRLGGNDDEAEAWKEVGRGLRRLERVHDSGLYTTEPPRAGEA